MAPANVPASIPAGRAVSFGVDGTYMAVQNGYSRGRKHQWGPELARNGLQALLRSIAAGKKARGDEEIVFDFTPIAILDEDGNPIRSNIWKRRIWNTCDNMTPVELMDYFSSLAKGAGTNRFSVTNLAGQYGQGSRYAVLPHSHMFVATTEPGGGTNALLIHDTGHDTYSLVNFSFPDRGTGGEDHDLADMRENCYIDLGGGRYLWMDENDLIHPDVILNGGVTTILMGPDLLEHYVEGDPLRGESSRALVDDLTKWLNFPVPVSVEYTYESRVKPRASKQIHIGAASKYVESRTLKTYDDWTARVPAGNQTTVNLQNPDGAATTEVDVYLLAEDWNWTPAPLKASGKNWLGADGKVWKGKTITPDPNIPTVVYGVTEKDAWMPWDGKGFVVLAYDYERIPLYDNYNRTQQLKQWGVNVAEVAERCALVIRCPQLQAVGSTAWGVQQTGSRGTLLGPNETALPVDDWTNEFFDLLGSLPDLDFLRKALEAAKPTKARSIDPDDLKRIQEEMQGRMDLTPQDVKVKTKVDTGELADENTTTVQVTPESPHGPGPRPKPSKKPVPTVTPNPAGPVFAKTVKAPMMPDYEFLSVQEWADKEKSDPQYIPEEFCVVEDGGAGTTLYFNRGHEIFIGQRTYYTSPTGYFKEIGNLKKLKMLKLADIEQVIEDVYATLGIGTVFYALRMSKRATGRVDRHKFHSLVEPERMTMALGSFVNVDYPIKGRIGRL